MVFGCEEEVKPGSTISGKCTDCGREFSITAPERNKSTVFSCPYCGTTNTLQTEDICQLRKS